MDPKNGIERRMAKKDIKIKQECSTESEETEQFISAIEQRSWQEAVEIIVTKGSIKLVAV